MGVYWCLYGTGGDGVAYVGLGMADGSGGDFSLDTESSCLHIFLGSIDSLEESVAIVKPKPGKLIPSPFQIVFGVSEESTPLSGSAVWPGLAL